MIIINKTKICVGTCEMSLLHSNEYDKAKHTNKLDDIAARRKEEGTQIGGEHLRCITVIEHYSKFIYI